MSWSKLSAMVVVCLMLSPHARCAAAESAKAPLTAAELAQCKARLASVNQEVDAYNAKLDDIKALEAEIDAMRPQLEKEAATVDRSDKEATQVLNAKIQKNNELVARHKQMAAALEAAENENKQHAAQFHEACENRALAQRTPASMPSPGSASASASACASSTGTKDVERQIQGIFADMRADEKKHQAEVERVAQAQAKAQSWNNDKQGKVWLQLMASPKFMAFEREKQPYVQELMQVLRSKPKSGQEECKLMQRIAATLPAIKAINARQYAFMADEIRNAK